MWYLPCSFQHHHSYIIGSLTLALTGSDGANVAHGVEDPAFCAQRPAWVARSYLERSLEREKWGGSEILLFQMQYLGVCKLTQFLFLSKISNFCNKYPKRLFAWYHMIQITVTLYGVKRSKIGSDLHHWALTWQLISTYHKDEDCCSIEREERSLLQQK